MPGFWFRPSISKGGGGKVLANLLVQNSRAQALCFMVFTRGISLSDSLETEASLQSIYLRSLEYCSGFSWSKRTRLPAYPLLYQQQLTNIKILTVVDGYNPTLFWALSAGVVFVLKSYLCNFHLGCSALQNSLCLLLGIFFVR